MVKRTRWEQLAGIPTFEKNADITKAEIEAKLIGEISSHTHALEVDDEPVSNSTTTPISSNWAFSSAKEAREAEEAAELANLTKDYNTMMANEHYTSDRRGYEVR
jgi:hypothetical protein